MRVAPRIVSWLSILIPVAMSLPGCGSPPSPSPDCTFPPVISKNDVVQTSGVANISVRDREMECFLEEARIVQIHKVIGSTTFPMSLDLELNGKTGKALFKYSDKDRPPGDRQGPEAADQKFGHGYLYEVAAYRLDRMLGLGMVPVVVIRDVNTEGALIEWLSGAVSIKQLRDTGQELPDESWLDRQRAGMNLFDALILNPDRHDSDQLIVPGSATLHIIDHGQAFGCSPEVPESFTARSASLPDSVLKRLEKLTKELLKERLDGSLTDAEIVALLQRRDAILVKIAEDRERYGISN
jgi:hypothetical protein